MSTLRTTTLQDAAGNNSVPMATVAAGTAKAWVNFNGTGTVSIRSSFNVNTITDRGAGTYTVNFASPMADVNYAVVTGGSAQSQYGADYPLQGPSFDVLATGSVNIATGSNTSALVDWNYIAVAVFD